MIGIVSMLAGESGLQVIALQRKLNAVCGATITGLPHPHLTYLIASGEADSQFLSTLAQIASRIDPLSVRVTGLGVFPGAEPVLFLLVPRVPELAALHLSLCNLAHERDAEVDAYYVPKNWLPHITLANRGLCIDRAAGMLGELYLQPLDLDIRFAGLRLAREVAPDEWEIIQDFPFSGENTLGPNPFLLTSRPCQPSDRDFVYRVVERTLKPYVSAYYDWDEGLFDRNFQRSWRQRIIILHAGLPVGTIGYDTSRPDHFYISGLFLDPAYHGRGWGRYLLGQMEKLGKGRSIRLHVWENNPAEGFYRRHGYRVVGNQGHKLLMEKTDQGM